MSTPHWTRRAFLRAGATTAGGLAAGCASSFDPKPASGGRIDAHAHVWCGLDEHYPRVPSDKPMNPTTFLPEILLAHAVHNGLRRAVLAQPACYGIDCSYIADSMVRFPGRLAGIGLVDWRHEPRVGLDRMAAQGMRGVRVQALGADHYKWMELDAMHELWNRAAELDVSICILPEPRAYGVISALCTRHPETTVVIDHMGWLGAREHSREFQVDEFLRLAEHRNVHVKISRLHHFERAKPPYLEAVPLIQRVVRSFGPERAMWGSDAPGQVRNGHTIAASLDLIRKHAGFSLDEQEWLLRRTAEGLFFPA